MCIETNWPDSIFTGLIYSTMTSKSFPFCKTTDSLDVRSNIYKSAYPARIIAKSNNLNTGILICLNTEFKIINWGYESKIDRKEVYTTTNSTWAKFNIIDTSRFYYWAYTSNDTNCPSKSFYNQPYTPKITSIKDKIIGKIEVYPNPGNGIYTILSTEPGANISIYNTLGQEIKRIVCDNLSTEIDLTSEQGNLFIFKVTTSETNQTIKVIRN
jgi:hypothetical protein